MPQPPSTRLTGPAFTLRGLSGDTLTITGQLIQGTPVTVYTVTTPDGSSQSVWVPADQHEDVVAGARDITRQAANATCPCVLSPPSDTRRHWPGCDLPTADAAQKEAA